MAAVDRATIVRRLHPRVASLLYEKGWRNLTPIQEASLESILAGDNVLIVAPTGEGKTEAALLPLFSLMLETKAEPISLLYVTPMKALINDLYRRIGWWASRLGFTVARKHGDTSAVERSRRLREKPHILIITPESLEIDLDWAHRVRSLYRNLRWVVVDEAHELLSGKRGAQFILQLERLARIAGRDIQRIGLSATIGNPEKSLRLLAGSSRRSRRVIKINSNKKPELKIVFINDKRGNVWSRVAENLVREIEKPSLVFVNSRYVAERVKDSLEAMNVEDVFVHHSSVSPQLRKEAEEKLREGRLSAIVCTKTLEVGIDVGLIKKVIQIKSPGRPSSLLQRVGRSGHRLGENPRGTLISIGEMDFLESIAVSLLALEGRVEDTVIERIPLDVIAKEVQGILLERGEELVDTIYEIISSHPQVKLSRDEFEELIDYLASLGVVRRRDGLLRLGSTFYKIWRFRKSNAKNKTWWARDFSEFFSTITERDSFIVKNGNHVIGYIDSLYVYKFLRVGDSIRLAGRSWKIKRIDDNLGKIEVVPSEEQGEIPVWRGEAARRPLAVAKTLAGLLWGDLSVNSLLVENKRSLRKLEEWKKIYKKLNIKDKEVIIYEVYGNEHIVTAPLGSGAAEAVALLLSYLASSETGFNVYYRSMFMGFSIYLENMNIFDLINKIDLNDINYYFEKALERSPYFYQIIRDIQFSFGKIGNVDLEKDYVLVNEAKKQLIENYLDIPNAKKFIEKIKNNKINIIRPFISGLTPIAKEILKMPPIKPWMPDLAGRIAKLVEGSALTVMEIADILELSEKTVESKIKDMRREEYNEKRLVGFIDLDEDEWRWTLVKSINEVSDSEEFSESFKPHNLEEPIRVYLWLGTGKVAKELILTPKLILEKWDEISNMLPNEIYKVKVISAYDYGGRDDVSVVHYHIPKTALKYILLNAAAYLQEKNAGYYW